MNRIISASILTSLAVMTLTVALSCQPIPSSEEAAVAGSPQPPSSLTIEQYMEQGSIAHEKAQYGEAIQDFTKAIELNPRYSSAYYERSKIYFYKSDWVKAVTDCNRTLELDPSILEAYYVRGLAYIKQQQYAKAAGDFNIARGMETSEKESMHLKELTDLAIPIDELVLLDAASTSQQTGICNAGICYAPIAFNVTVKVDLFVNPGKSGTTVSSINVSPDIEGKSLIEVNRFFSNYGIQGFSINISSLVPASSTLNYSATYKSRNDLLYRKSNSITHG